MPHKTNPIGSEKVSGLARIVRSMALASLENDVLWDERDLTNSSAERVIIPETFGLVSEQLKTLIEVVKGLELDGEAIERNLNLTKGEIYSELVLSALIESGMKRGEAHRLIRGISEEAERSALDFLTALSKNETVSRRLNETKLRGLLDPQIILPFSDQIIDRALEEAKDKLEVT